MRNIKFGIKISLLLLVSLVITFALCCRQEVITYSNEGELLPFNAITKENIAIQEIKIQEETTINKIAIMFATYNKTKTPKVTVEYYKNQELINICQIGENELDDNQYYRMPVKCDFDKDDSLWIVIKTDLNADTEMPVTVYVTNKKSNNALFRYSEKTNIYEAIDGELNLQIIKDGFPLRVENGEKKCVFEVLYFLMVMGTVLLVIMGGKVYRELIR